MLLFKEEHRLSIQDGRKTQTRRLWGQRRVRVGAIHQARTKMLDKSSTFAYLRIKRVWRENNIVWISREDALAEGYDSPILFLAAFDLINPGLLRFDVPLPCWAVEFEVVPQGGVTG